MALAAYHFVFIRYLNKAEGALGLVKLDALATVVLDALGRGLPCVLDDGCIVCLTQPD